MRKAFNFYKSFYDVALLLPEKDQIEFIMAICHAQFTGEIIEPKSQLAKLAFTSQLHSIKKQLDGYKSAKKEAPYEAPCQGSYEAPSVQVQEQEKEQEKEQVQEKPYRAFKHLCMTLSEFDKVVALGYTKQQIDNVLNSIQNYRKNTNYVDLYLTCLKWIRKEYPNVEKPEVKKSKGTIHDNHF